MHGYMLCQFSHQRLPNTLNFAVSHWIALAGTFPDTGDLLSAPCRASFPMCCNPALSCRITSRLPSS
ncbi:protein of unknown function [Pseudorhizobium banfieldiae]|uniref:Uncharacterized protein n=1 Tax=Pseudorhizobium banfieldiae TaxID=1125847 RepID=L0NE64_9HYPH|nr:protein of unknown function [Pseudorhizobium banfieldiae]